MLLLISSAKCGARLGDICLIEHLAGFTDTEEIRHPGSFQFAKFLKRQLQPQFKNAPIAGKMMASLVAYCEAGIDHDSKPLQFELPYIGRTIDAGFYSRKREINPESSFSVLG